MNCLCFGHDFGNRLCLGHELVCVMDMSLKTGSVLDICRVTVTFLSERFVCAVTEQGVDY